MRFLFEFLCAHNLYIPTFNFATIFDQFFYTIKNIGLYKGIIRIDKKIIDAKNRNLFFTHGHLFCSKC